MATFPDIAAAARDVDSPGDELLFQNFYDRDEGLREHPFFLALAEVSTTSTTFVTVASFKLYVPISPKRLVLAFQARTVLGTGSYQFIIGALTSDTQTTTSTTYVDTLRCTFSDVSTVAGTEVTLSLQIKNSGVNLTYAKQTEGPACRFLAAA